MLILIKKRGSEHDGAGHGLLTDPEEGRARMSQGRGEGSSSRLFHRASEQLWVLEECNQAVPWRAAEQDNDTTAKSACMAGAGGVLREQPGSAVESS